MGRLAIEEVDGVTVAAFQDSKILDDAVIQQIGSELLECVSQTSGGKLLLDFSRVRFMSSAMLGRLVMLHGKCKKANVTLKMCCLADNLREVFKITNLHKMFDIQKDRDKAIASFSKKGWFG